MYSYIIKTSNILSFVFIVFAGYFLQFTTASASVLTGTSIEVYTVNDVHATRTLHYGMQGGDIKDLQEELRALPSIYPSGKVTSYFGPATLAAVGRFQKQEQAKKNATSTTIKLGIADTRTQTMIHLRVIEKKCPQRIRSRQKCLEEQYEHYANSGGVDSALNLLRLHVSDEARFEGVCHGVMHHIAHIAVHEFKDFGTAMYHGTTLCQNGYYHGVVEEYLRNENVDAISPDVLRNFCSTSLKPTSSATDILNCVHGLGHALMYMTRNDLPKSLVRCGDISDDHMRSQCLTGAFMEESFSASSSKKVDIDKQVVACTQVSQEQDVCYIRLSAKVISENGANGKIAGQFCDTLIDTNNQHACKSAVTNTNN